MRIAQRKFRIPDICALRTEAAAEDILSLPPLIAIEILSPEDTIRRVTKKAAEYIEFGIEHAWIIDLQARVAYRRTTTTLERVPSGELAVSGTPIVIRIAELFEKLDRIRAAAGNH